MWPIEARNAAIANHCFTCGINRVGTVSTSMILSLSCSLPVTVEVGCSSRKKTALISRVLQKCAFGASGNSSVAVQISEYSHYSKVVRALLSLVTGERCLTVKLWHGLIAVSPEFCLILCRNTSKMSLLLVMEKKVYDLFYFSKRFSIISFI